MDGADPKVVALALSGIVGGGYLGFIATDSILGEGLLSTESFDEERAKLGPVVTVLVVAAATWLLWDSYKEGVKQIGWGPLLLGSGIVTAIGLVREASDGD